MFNPLMHSPRHARLVLHVAVLGFLVLLVWAWQSNIDQVTRVSGQVIASARTQVVQTPDGGVLQRLAVKEGDTVTKGQVLAVLESSRVQAAVNDTSAKVAALQITLARLTAEAYGRPLVIPQHLGAYKEYIQNQSDLYKQRQRALNEELQALQTSMQLSKDELEMNQPLLKTGDISRADILRLQRQVADIQSQITNRRNKYFQDTQAEMTKIQEDLKTQTEALSDRKQLLKHTDLVAPANGIVKNIKLNTEGGVLRAGDELMQILPTESALIVEAKLKPVDIAFIKVGLPVTVKFDAYDYSIFGAMHGYVSYISADTLSEDTRQGELVYYRIQVRINEPEFKGSQALSIDIRPGLTASVEIRTGERSVLSYLTKPITKSFGQGLGER
ncbi:MAG: HlyD family type I secretion periplasmic adaptor subunit [Pseudomonadota bacterium]